MLLYVRTKAGDFWVHVLASGVSQNRSHLSTLALPSYKQESARTASKRFQAAIEGPVGSKVSSLHLDIRHRYGGFLSMNASARVAGTDNTPILVLELRRDDEFQGTMALNTDGLVQFCDSTVASMLGYEPATLIGQRIDALLPKPLGER